jgi:hypothetical protein
MSLKVGGRRLRCTEVFRSYWWLAAERQRIFLKRLHGLAPPWTADPVIASHRFTNAYRASDRVSQFLINDVIYGASVDERSSLLRILLFKIFNRIDTWKYLEEEVGCLSLETFNVEVLAARLDERRSSGGRLYSAAYIMPSPKFESPRKHVNHLRLLDQIVADGTIDRLLRSSSLRDLYSILCTIPSFGPFLAFQFAIDLNYSSLFDFSEMDFVVAGPGARDGIARCFPDAETVDPADVIRAVTESANDFFSAYEISFEDLWGRPLQLIDCQNLFCEVEKYARVVHPESIGVSGRTRIKQRFSPNEQAMNLGYPPRWGLPFSAGLNIGDSGSRQHDLCIELKRTA